jgi:hypothetical protein
VSDVRSRRPGLGGRTTDSWRCRVKEQAHEGGANVRIFVRSGMAYLAMPNGERTRDQLAVNKGTARGRPSPGPWLPGREKALASQERSRNGRSTFELKGSVVAKGSKAASTVVSRDDKTGVQRISQVAAPTIKELITHLLTERGLSGPPTRITVSRAIRLRLVLDLDVLSSMG